MSVLSFLGGLVEPITGLIGDMHTSEEEKAQLRNQLIQLQNEMAGKLLEYEKDLLQAKADIVMAEAQGKSWIQRSWRPITMLTFLVLVVMDTMGFTEFRLSEQAWTLLQIGLGGYVVGRSAEKIAPQLKEGMVGRREGKQ